MGEIVRDCNGVRAHAVITNSKHQSTAAKIGEQSRVGRQKFLSILSTTCLLTPGIDMSTLTFCSGRVLDQNKPSLVIFTSGSTGPPKGVAIRRYNLYAGAHMMIQAQNISPKTTVAQFLPIHHAAGLLFNSLPGILGGGCVEFCQGGFEASKVWQRFREGGLPSFSAVPTVYVRLIRYWQSVIAKLSTAERDSYRLAVSGIGSFHSGTSALPRQVSEQWFKITGKPIIERYGGSEMGNVYTNLPGRPIVPVRGDLLMTLAFRWMLFNPSLGLRALENETDAVTLTSITGFSWRQKPPGRVKALRGGSWRDSRPQSLYLYKVSSMALSLPLPGYC